MYLIPKKWAFAPGIGAAGRFDENYIGPEIRKHFAAILSGLSQQLEYANTG